MIIIIIVIIIIITIITKVRLKPWMEKHKYTSINQKRFQHGNQPSKKKGEKRGKLVYNKYVNKNYI